MSQFEFILTGFSIVLALSVARLLDGLRPTFQPGRFYWIHALWVVIKLMDATMYFWSAWTGEGVGGWTFTDFVIVIASPGILYLQANALVTTKPDEVEDWREHYFSIHRYFFIANFLLAPVGLLTIHVVGDQPFPIASTFGFGLSAILAIVAAVSSSSRVHAAVAVITAANIMFVFGSNITQLGNQ